ncbi:MAG: hypothetical protein IJ608_03370 [Lachnospiraceae bacterium]|nr:hypothetical protein [Lachnospiraceae bacterium]
MDDIKKKVDEVVAKLKADPKLIENFKKEPVKTIEGLSGIDIPDNIEDKVVAGVKTALAGDKLGGIADTVKKLF